MKDQKKVKLEEKRFLKPFFLIIALISVFLVFIYVYLIEVSFESSKSTLFEDIGIFFSESKTDAFCEELKDSLTYRCEDRFFIPTNFINGYVICDHSIQTDLKYLPSKNFYSCLKSNPPKEWKVDQAKIFEEIHRIQNPEDCNFPNSREYTKPTWLRTTDEEGFFARKKFEPERPGDLLDEKPKWNLIGWLHHGYAYNLFVMSWNAQNHWNGGVSVITGNSKYRFSDIDCGKAWSCYLSPLSRCKLENIKNESVLVYYNTASRRLVMDLTQLCKPNGYYDYYNGRCVCDKGFMPSRFDEYSGCAPYHTFDFDKIYRRRLHRDKWESDDPKIKKAVREGDDFYFSLLAPSENNPGLSRNPVQRTQSDYRDKHGFLWEHAQYLWYLHKNNPKRQFLDEYVMESGLDLNRLKPGEINAVGIHVRHGDSCHDKYQNHRVCLPLSSYMEAVKELEEVYGKYDIIFLATDDPEVIEATKPYIKEGYTFAYQKISRLIYETGDKNGVDVRIEFNSPQLVKEIVADIWALSYCNAFVGSFASSVAWVAYELMLARSGFYPPFISVDLPYAHKKNVGRFL